MRIVFWGTPEFAVPSLLALTEEGHAVQAVVTRPDRPAGRGRRVRPGPLNEAARDVGIPVLQPETPRDPELRARLAALRPDVSVVVAYGGFLPESLLELPPRGTLNLHPSLLPELRGAAPIPWTIIRGHERSGVSVIRLVCEMDAGPILHQAGVELPPRVTAGELTAMLSELGATALVEVLALLEAGRSREVEQDHARATFAPRLERNDARLRWELPAAEVERWIRGCDPDPGAWSVVEGVPVQLFRPELEPEAPGEGATPGTVVVADPKGGVVVRAGEGAVRVGEVKPAGRDRMEAAAWVRGRGVREGDRLT